MAHLHKTSDDFADKTQNSIDMKSAVISGAFEGLSKDEIDKFYTQNLSEVQSFKPKKGSFQITSVTSGNNVTRDDDPGEDSQDDLDDTHTYTEDNMSMDWSRHTDLEADRGLLIEQEEPHDDLTLHRPVPKTSDAGQSVKERSSTDNQSRFRVVKIVTHEPFKRGRWTCFDFLQDPNKPNPDNVNLDFKESKDHVVVTGSETSSAASSIHYVHGQDDPAKNPLNAQPLTQTLTSPIYFDDKHQPQINPVLNGQENFDHLEPSNTGVKTPESFPTTNGNGPYVSQPPVHQASMPPSLTTIVGNSSMTHTSATNQPSQVTSLAHGSLGLPTTEAALSNVLSSGYAREPGGGVYGAELSHSTPRTASRAMNIDRPSSRTHRISIGGEELEVSDDFGAGNLLEQIAGKPGALASPTKENDGEDSGPNSVAIDNKIEQAMDLVKSHLMFAVREEVEVLKEQINDLEEAKRKLEFENTVLKAAASAETLAKLAQAQQQNPLAPT